MGGGAGGGEPCRRPDSIGNSADGMREQEIPNCGGAELLFHRGEQLPGYRVIALTVRLDACGCWVFIPRGILHYFFCSFFLSYIDTMEFS